MLFVAESSLTKKAPCQMPVSVLFGEFNKADENTGISFALVLVPGWGEVRLRYSKSCEVSFRLLLQSQALFLSFLDYHLPSLDFLCFGILLMSGDCYCSIL